MMQMVAPHRESSDGKRQVTATYNRPPCCEVSGAAGRRVKAGLAYCYMRIEVGSGENCHR